MPCAAIGTGQSAFEVLPLTAQGRADIRLILAKQLLAHEIPDVNSAHLFGSPAEPLEIGAVGKETAQLAGPVAHHAGDVVGDRFHESLTGLHGIRGFSFLQQELPQTHLIGIESEGKGQCAQRKPDHTLLQVALPVSMNAVDPPRHRNAQRLFHLQFGGLHGALGNHALLAHCKDGAGKHTGSLPAIPMAPERGSGLIEILADDGIRPIRPVHKDDTIAVIQ